MPLNLDDKKNIVAQINETANQSLSLVIADDRGVDVSDMNALRSLARKENIDIKVVRNTLAKKAFESTDYGALKAYWSDHHCLRFQWKTLALLQDYLKVLRKRMTILK